MIYNFFENYFFDGRMFIDVEMICLQLEIPLTLEKLLTFVILSCIFSWMGISLKSIKVI